MNIDQLPGEFRALETNQHVSELGPNAKDCVVIGTNNYSDHEKCVLIGHGLKSTDHNQLIIGNSKVTTSREMTDDEFKEIRAVFLGLTRVP